MSTMEDRRAALTTFAELPAMRAEQAPDAPAVWDDHSQLDNAGLLDRVERAAAALVRAGVGFVRIGGRWEKREEKARAAIASALPVLRL